MRYLLSLYFRGTFEIIQKPFETKGGGILKLFNAIQNQ